MRSHVTRVVGRLAIKVLPLCFFILAVVYGLVVSREGPGGEAGGYTLAVGGIMLGFALLVLLSQKAYLEMVRWSRTELAKDPGGEWLPTEDMEVLSFYLAWSRASEAEQEVFTVLLADAQRDQAAAGALEKERLDLYALLQAARMLVFPAR